MGAVTARDLKALLADNENEASIMAALDSLDEIEPPPESIDAAKKITALRNELLQELNTIRGQGSLF